MDNICKALQWHKGHNASCAPFSIAPWNEKEIRIAHQFHASFPQYAFTPLLSLESLAHTLGVGSIMVKDESQRFSLNAFKVLGGSYVIGKYIACRLGTSMADLSYALLTSDAVKDELGDLTFVTATDGNHGRGVAWTASRLRQKSVVYMPKGSAPERLANIRAAGATATITEYNYDDTVRYVRDQAEKNGWIVLQDTTWEGYEEIPTWIMQGYGTIAYEIDQQLQAAHAAPPTHIFLQAGAGSFAGAMTACFANLYPTQPPRFTIAEPLSANCIYRTAAANDGKLHCITEDWFTIMAGLSVGEPCSVGWQIMSKHADDFISCPDAIAAKGMRVLSSPLGQDSRIISGESGALGLGLLAELMSNPAHSALRHNMHLGPDSRILCISTEGDTDKAQYQRIVWDGEYPSVY